MIKAHVDALRPLAGVFSESHIPPIFCPFCMNATMAAGTISYEESAESRRLKAQYEAEWEPDWAKGLFWTTIHCPRCKTRCSVTGDMSTAGCFSDESGLVDDYIQFFQVKFVYPALRLMNLPPETPETFIALINEASELIWANPDATANRIRVAIEELMTARGMVKGKLHTRINAFRKENADVAEYLEAVKWIGNDGSHETGLTVYDVLNGIEMLQHAIDNLYDRSHIQLAARMRQINQDRTIKPKTEPSF